MLMMTQSGGLIATDSHWRTNGLQFWEMAKLLFSLEIGG